MRPIRQVLICFQVNRMHFPHFKIEEFRVKNELKMTFHLGQKKLGRVKIGCFKLSVLSQDLRQLSKGSRNEMKSLFDISLFDFLMVSPHAMLV